MDRREFLRRALSLAAPVIVLPAAAKIFLPPRGGWPLSQRYNFSTYLTINEENQFTYGDVEEMLAAFWDKYRVVPDSVQIRKIDSKWSHLWALVTKDYGHGSEGRLSASNPLYGRLVWDARLVKP